MGNGHTLQADRPRVLVSRKALPVSDGLRDALRVFARDGSAKFTIKGFLSAGGTLLKHKTVFALYDRYLVTIIVESRYRTRHVAKLTELGEYAARGLPPADAPKADDDFEDAALVYGDNDP